MAGNYNYFEGITVRNTNVAFMLGIKDIAGASGFTLKHRRSTTSAAVFRTDWSGSKDYYIADNVFIGRHDPDKMHELDRRGGVGEVSGLSRRSHSEYAIKVYGQGHVVAHNYVANWHDGIDVATYGDPDGTPDEIARPRSRVHRLLRQRHLQHGRQLHRSRTAARTTSACSENRCFNSAGGRAQRAADFRRAALLLSAISVYTGTTGGYLKLVDTPAGVLLYQNTFIGQIRCFGPASNLHLAIT